MPVPVPPSLPTMHPAARLRIVGITATEVIVRAHPERINSPTLDRPLHKLTVDAQPGWSVQFDEVPKLLVQITLEDGTVGLGECYRAHDWNVIGAIARRLLGQSIATMNRQMLPIAWCREYDGFECAIWDAFARSHGLRIVDLLGGAVRDQVPVGAWSGHRTLDEIPPLAELFSRAGFTCIKFKCDLADDVAGWCAAIRDVDPHMKVILDPNERWERPAEARQRIDALSGIGNVLCLEDPIPRWMIADYRDLRTYSSIPIVLHVSLPYIAHGQKVQDAVVALEQRAVDGFNFNGGLARFAQLNQIADAAGLPCWHGSEIDLGILEAMYVHSCAAAASCTWPSDIFGRLIRTHDLLRNPLRIEPPVVLLPEGPGLGVELDEEAVLRHQTRKETYA